MKIPDRNEILSILKSSNLHAAPGTDGITSYFYLKMFDKVEEPLTDVITNMFQRKKPTKSQWTCNIIFANKSNKSDSIKLKDKRKISLINANFKILSGIGNRWHSTILDHTVSDQQFALGKNKNIHHAIAMARDAIRDASKEKKGSAIANLYFMSAFNFICMDWVYLVLERIGMQAEAIERIRRYYEDSTTIPIVNNVPGWKICNRRITLIQGDCPISVWFGYGVDPLLAFLEKHLQGITIVSQPKLGPSLKN